MPRPALQTPPKPSPGDRVAIVSPSWAGPGAFPAIHELAMRRLRDDFGLEPVEYPTTRMLGASPEARATDVMAAFADTSIRAVMASIGGDDQIRVIPHLDPAVALGDPKPFFGYSDNTNLLNWLWSNGIVAYHGGSTMVHLGRGGEMHPATADSLRRALFTTGPAALQEVGSFSEDEVGWASPDALTRAGPTQPAAGWGWHNADRTVAGPTWGGNLEVLHWIAAAGRLGPPPGYEGCILMVETSEEMPSATEVYRMLRNLGERGVLGAFAGVVVGRPKAASLESPRTSEERERYRADQQDAILRALGEYNPDAVVIFGLDIGHTDPQLVVPYGGVMRLDGAAGTVTVEY
jgi:muramoyltetrapeptide carboxypeptidase LdcA involved in peptidoglycan recycling